MIVVFDLDDTLYPELSYVRSGFRAASKEAANRFGVDANEAYRVLMQSLEEHGRGRQFDDLCRWAGKHSRSNVRALVHAYRHHTPDLVLPDWADQTLNMLGDRRIFIVTDGHKVVQAKKIEALGLAQRVEHAYLTNRYGVRHQKPDPYVFRLIERRTSSAPSDCVYIGDNPRKDFHGIRPRGWRTIRVLTGSHADVRVPEQNAETSIDSLPDCVAIIEDMEGNKR